MGISKNIIAGTVSVAMLVGAPAAVAQTSAQQGYSTPGGVVQTELTHTPSHRNQPHTVIHIVHPKPAATTEQHSSGKLPFTGLDIALVVAAGGMLMGLGFGIRRLSRPADVA
jgi:uncharacterized membrane-anchored protein YitT (DUF2179 family)